METSVFGVSVDSLLNAGSCSRVVIRTRDL